MKTRYKWIFKEGWFSFCSTHFEYDNECELCQCGYWRNLLWIGIINWIKNVKKKIK